MIEEGRMNGEIDQVDEIIRFEQLGDEAIWNNQIKHTCDQINATGTESSISRFLEGIRMKHIDMKYS